MDFFDLHLWPTFKQKATAAVINDVSIDSRIIRTPCTLFVALPGRKNHGHHYVAKALERGALFALVEETWAAPPSVDEDRLIRVPSTLLALQDLAKYYRASLPHVDIVAIAGSCGKTMLKDFLAHIFSEKEFYTSPESFNSQLGVALSILGIPRETKLAFIEMAATEEGEMNHLVSMASPRYAIITNLYRRRLGSLEMKERVIKELCTLVQALPKDGFALVEKDFPPLPRTECSLLFWNESCSLKPSSYITELRSIATQASLLLGKKKEETAKKISLYVPKAMRTDIWKDANSTTFISLPYSKTPLSFEASLDELTAYGRATQLFSSGKNILFFEGLHSESDPEPFAVRLAESMAHHAIHEVYCWKKPVWKALSQKLPSSISLRLFPSFEDALLQTKKNFRPHDTVIFKGEKKFELSSLLNALDESTPNTFACINLAAIRSNITCLQKKLNQSTRIMVMVKALAYGTDDVRISHFLRSCGVDILGVASVDEGVRMRSCGISQALFTLHACEHEMKKAIRFGLEIGVSSLSQLLAAQAAAQELKTSVKIHLHVDTGMKRFGCRPEDAVKLAEKIAATSVFDFEGIFTHFAAADDPSQDTFTLRQAKTLEDIILTLEKRGISPKYRHACNSAGAIRFSFPAFNMVRIGLATYGFHTSSNTKPLMELRPALSLFSKIVGFNEGTCGDTVSYGRTHVIEHPRAKIAIIPIGYYDGLHRSYSNKASVLIKGIAAPVIGRINMDYTMIDVTHIPEVSLGDTVLLFGEDEDGVYLSPEDFAARGGSITHELLACLGPRIQRLFIYDESLITSL